jgi:hypothetical protein
MALEIKQALDVIEQRNLELQLKKNSIATTLSNKGVSTQGTDSFDAMIANVGSIKTKLTIPNGYVGVAFDIDEKMFGITSLEERENFIGYDFKKISSIGTKLDIGLVGDEEGSIYFNTSTDGMIRTKHVMKIDKQGNSSVFSLESNVECIAGGINYLFASSKGKIYKIDFTSVDEAPFIEVPNTPTSMYATNDRLYVGFSNGGVGIYTFDLEEISLITLESDSPITTIRANELGYIATYSYIISTLNVYDPTHSLILPISDYNIDSSYRNIFYFVNKTLYLSNVGNGFMGKIDLTSEEIVDMSLQGVVAIMNDKEGNFYTIKYNSKEVIKFSPNFKQLVSYMIEELDSSDIGLKYYFDDSGIYLNSSTGILHYKINTEIEKIVILKELE